MREVNMKAATEVLYECNMNGKETGEPCCCMDILEPLVRYVLNEDEAKIGELALRLLGRSLDEYIAEARQQAGEGA